MISFDKLNQSEVFCNNIQGMLTIDTKKSNILCKEKYNSVYLHRQTVKVLVR